MIELLRYERRMLIQHFKKEIVMHIRVRTLLAALALAIVTLSGRSSHADNCSVTLAPMFSARGAHIQMTISTVDTRWVSYTDGFIYLSGGWLTGTQSQLFNDRTTTIGGGFGTLQPFYVFARDTHTPYIGSNGEVWIWNNTWGFWNHFFGSCSAGFLYGFADNAMFSISVTPSSPPVVN
jgi:hypothetical protein